MKSSVAVVACADYQYENVRAAVRRGMALLGGIDRFARAGENILLKPNLLAGDEPQKAVTTHPAVFRAVIEAFQEKGARLSFGDSPGFGSLRHVAARAGLVPIAQEYGVKQADFQTAAQISFPEALIARQLELARSALETDGIVNLPKMKTHGLLRITGAIKNLLGCVPGLRKSEFHLKMPKISHFAAMLVDLARALKPRLHIMDGLVAMDGNGPRAGALQPMKTLLLSEDPVALDTVFCRLIALPPSYVPTLESGRQSGLGTCREDEIELLGDPLRNLARSDFEVVRRPADDAAGSFPVFLKNWVSPRPVIDYERCVNCGTCVQICPTSPKALARSPEIVQGKPFYDYLQCIRCYCCQETCPHSAIRIHTPPLGRLIHR